MKSLCFGYLTFIFTLTVSFVRAIPPTQTVRAERSGGYPKFPENNLLFHETCGTRSVAFNPQRSPKIVGGSIAPYGAFPWQVEIQIFRYEKSTFEHHCGGAVIGDNLVITAAHCMEPQQNYLRLVIGNYDLAERDMYERSFRIDRVLTHPEFRLNGPYSNDIAIIKVKATVINFNSHVKPICLPSKAEVSYPGTWCTVTGWGAQDGEDKESLASVLRAAAVPLMDQSTCRNSEANGRRNQKILDSMLCAGFLQGGIGLYALDSAMSAILSDNSNVQLDSCGGDSGGPLACEFENRFYLQGIVSWGDGCARKNRPGIYTRVDSYIDWILQSVEELQ